ncbi:unnamed protein product, partial [Brassica rapa subsp. trilocularis]
MLSGKGKEKEPAGASVVSLTTRWADVGPQDDLPSGQTQTCHGDGVTIASIGLPHDKAADKLSLQEEDVGLAFNMGTWNSSQADKISVPVGIPYEGGADDCQIIGGVIWLRRTSYTLDEYSRLGMPLNFICLFTPLLTSSNTW